jgi:hypothetical protein
VQALARATPHARLINVRDPDVLATVRTIASCDFVVSSSLHGLIAADAFGIPNVWVRWSDRVAGGSWKFLDYFRSVGRPERGPEPLPGELREVESRASLAAPQVVEARRRELLAAFHSMAL